ncbi:MAG TPA: ATP-binding protein, partial [Candidatus Krumholzibacteria bacterium]|nr:ATP-binding protein [Candidatus Krumholzibacteria bacterium]
VLSDYAGRHEIRQALRSPVAPDVDRLAFDLWADGPLSLLGYSCAIHIVTESDSVISEFSVDMPYRARIAEGGERTDTPDRDRWAVLDLTRSTPQGLVRFYRGVLNVDESDVYEQSEMARRVIGRVIVDVPFFFGSLELAARTGPRTPEVLRNVQEGGVAPRIEEPEALLLARVDRGLRITESSSARLAVGARVPGDVIERARAREWPLLRSASGTYRVVALDLDESHDTLLAGFAVPSPARHMLRWSTLFSLYLFFTLVMLLAVVALGAVPRVNRVLPALTPGGRLGFQQKLLASFLLVAMAPVVILGLFSVDFIKSRFTEESRDEASVKAFSARKAVANLLHGELQFFIARTDLSVLFTPAASRLQPLGGKRIAGLFGDAAAPAGAGGAAILGTVEAISGDDLALVTIGRDAYIGVFSAPLIVSGDEWTGRYYVYYARAIDGDLLAEIAEQVGADVNVYVDGHLVGSSREGLLAGGFISATMNADAFVEVSLLGSDRALATERAGSYDFQVAYLPVAHWRSESSDSAVVERAPARAALAVPLLFRPESYSLEVQRATSVILGVFALLLAATIALGLVVARGVFEPLRELVAGTRRISRGDYNVRLREDRADEVGIVATAFNEMTERIAESQRALEERRRYLEAILENIGAGVISTDAEGRVRTVNAAAERIAGVPAAEAVGRASAEVARTGHATRIFALLDPAADASSPFDTGELEIESGGRRATIKYMRTRLESGDRYVGTVFVFEDLTELIESKKLSAWVEMARQIAHEIKNPLTPIRISTQFMRRAYDQRAEGFDRIFKEGTETIIHQVDVLKRIAGEFSSFGRLQQLDLQPHAIDPLVRGIVAPYVHNGAGVRVVYENGTADARVVADAEAVRKICANLIENALEAMGTEGGELRVRCGETTWGGSPAVRIAFRDTGPGLNDEVTRRLFEPYFSTKTTGTGLGLAICRTLSREMGGDVTIHNVVGDRGVEATLTLRRAV